MSFGRLAIPLRIRIATLYAQYCYNLYAWQNTPTLPFPIYSICHVAIGRISVILITFFNHSIIWQWHKQFISSQQSRGLRTFKILFKLLPLLKLYLYYLQNRKRLIDTIILLYIYITYFITPVINGILIFLLYDKWNILSSYWTYFVDI